MVDYLKVPVSNTQLYFIQKNFFGNFSQNPKQPLADKLAIYAENQS